MVRFDPGDMRRAGLMDRLAFWDATVIAAVLSGQWQGQPAFALARAACDARDEFAAALASAASTSDAADAIAAGDGTLHGAIDHWQTRALDAERIAGEALDHRAIVAQMLALSPATTNDKICEALVALKSRARGVGQARPAKD